MPEVVPGWRRWLWLSAGIVLFDQLSKFAILASLVRGETLPLLPFFSLVLTFNPGAAFSFLADAAGWQRYFFLALALVAAVVLALMLRKSPSPWANAGFALIIGGALGNAIDRVRLGEVVDFVLVHWQGWYFPAFNLADSAITIGAGLLILDSFLHREPAAAQSKELP